MVDGDRIIKAIDVVTTTLLVGCLAVIVAGYLYESGLWASFLLWLQSHRQEAAELARLRRMWGE